MRPLTIAMEGFGAFRHRTEIDFTDAELIALVGPTGSGKSTIIDAITFALYGSVARYDDNRAVAPIVNTTSTQARVDLTFEVSGQRYRAVRVVRRTKQGATTPEARLERGEEVLAADARAVTETVTDLLGLDATQFNKTVVLPQGRFAEFLHDKPATRQATLRGLLDLGLYEQMGRAARQRAAAAQGRAEGYADDVATMEAELTDERRQELVSSAAALDQTINRVDEGLAERARLDADARRLGDERESLERTLRWLGSIAAPPDLDRLGAEQRAAGTELEVATARLDRARAARREAQAAAAAGPDLADAQLRRQAHAQHRHARAELARAAAEAESARQRADEAVVAAAARHEERARLEQAAIAAREAERAAQDRLDAAPDEAQTRAIVARHDLHDAALDRIDALAAAAATATRAAEEAAAALDAADDEQRRLRQALDRAQARAGVAGLAATLRVGDECPVCQQTVAVRPEIHGHEQVEELASTLELAGATVTTVRRRAGEAAHAAAAATAEHELARRSIIEAAAALAGQPDRAAAQLMLEQVGRAQAAVRAARRQARDAARAWDAARRDPAALAVLNAAEEATRAAVAAEATVTERQRHLVAAAARVAGLPGEPEVLAAIAEAERLTKRRQQADDELTRAEQDHADALVRRDTVEARLASARTALQASRDRLAALDPPGLDGDVASAWAQLTDWTDRQRAMAARRLRAAGVERDRIQGRRDAIELELRTAGAAVLDGSARPLDELRDAVVRRRAQVEATLAHFDADRVRLDELRARVTSRREEAAVADTLGRLLSASGFEAWLMAAALSELCARATTRLNVLSGGRYSLVLDGHEFLVRDHHNADEQRGVRTLSGGETFLASLALALALAEATAELASAGGPAIESIFLDEGFGTLDAETLEVVAGAIEELGATGRMVAIVTHIHELADRMPVRLDVAKGPGGSTVTRVD